MAHVNNGALHIFHFDLKSEAEDLVRLGLISILPEDLGETQCSHWRTLSITFDQFLPSKQE